MCMNRVIAKILQAVQQSLTKHAELAKKTSAARSIHLSHHAVCCKPSCVSCPFRLVSLCPIVIAIVSSESTLSCRYVHGG